MSFKIRGPFKLAVKALRDADSGIRLRVVDRAKTRELIANEELADKVGIYVMGVSRKGGSAEPWYVGKTEKKSLGYESLRRDKMRKYAQALISAAEGTPVLYFVAPRSGWDVKHIDRLETFLIWLARQRNPSLLNAKKVRLTPASLNRYLAELEIHGILNSSRGYPGDSISFRAMVGWNRVMHIAVESHGSAGSPTALL